MPTIAVGDPYAPYADAGENPCGEIALTPQPSVLRTYVYPKPTSTRCPSCGIDFGQNATIGYVCMSVVCPLQTKVTCETVTYVDTSLVKIGYSDGT